MATFMTKPEQQWGSARLGGFTVEECPLSQTEEGPYSGLFRLPKDFQFPHHRHQRWVQIFVIAGKIRVDVDGEEPRTIGAGEWYRVEAGDPHVETVVEDLTAYVVTAEDRRKLYESFGPGGAA